MYFIQFECNVSWSQTSISAATDAYLICISNIWRTSNFLGWTAALASSEVYHFRSWKNWSHVLWKSVPDECYTSGFNHSSYNKVLGCIPQRSPTGSSAPWQSFFITLCHSSLIKAGGNTFIWNAAKKLHCHLNLFDLDLFAGIRSVYMHIYLHHAAVAWQVFEWNITGTCKVIWHSGHLLQFH